MTVASEKGTGTGGSIWNGGKSSYPGVPYSILNFNDRYDCQSNDMNIHDYGNTDEVRNCRLECLTDLKQGTEPVQNKIVDYLNHMIAIGVAGFRIDAAKHMWPNNLLAIYQRLECLNTSYFQDSLKPYIFQEVIDMGGEPISALDYTSIGHVTNFIFGVKLAEVFRRQNPARHLLNWGESWNMPQSDKVVVFIDNHDNQRGHGAGGQDFSGTVLTHQEPKRYKMASAFMLAHPYGFARVMTHAFPFNTIDSDDGPPHNDDMSTRDLEWDPNDFSCNNGWVCEHRWRQIYNMVAFRNVVSGSYINNWWHHNDYQIAFSRGNKGFIAINADTVDLEGNFKTGLPQGIYCDVISGSYDGRECTGKEVHVNEYGFANFIISSNSDDPMMAIHIGAKIGSDRKVTT
ncbi:Hypothetical predicted protein [Mytilus galloprovincialis]|uniref:alpha-amylase n=1 Tax=Mytilus galloprovincialis TaxID=29158 RepID=A0A8B6DRV3_MYTGA|nr:Hypothetical predicted protein [Mytilus galloprovincialis]